MNIFVLDRDPALAAKYHCDRHVPKMILESTQMLSTVLDGPYKPTHVNHPCTKWVAESRSNAAWLISLAYHLHLEWRERWGHTRDHKCVSVLDGLISERQLASLPNIGTTPFALAMPDEFKTDDPVESYRAYYHSKTFASWERGAEPHWW